MERRGAMGGDGGAMVGSRVAFVLGPVVHGVLLVEAAHELIAVGLGEDRGSGDVAEAAVALDIGGEGNVAPGGEFVAVHDYRLRDDRERVEGPVHGENGGAEDVYLVDFLIIDHGDGPSHRLALDKGPESLSAGLRELLAIIEPLVGETVREDHCSGAYGPCEATTACFVATGLNDACHGAGGEQRMSLFSHKEGWIYSEKP